VRENDRVSFWLGEKGLTSLQWHVFLLLVAFEISCCRYISYSTMEWTGFTDEDLRRLQKSTSGSGNTLRG